MECGKLKTINISYKGDKDIKIVGLGKDIQRNNQESFKVSTAKIKSLANHSFKVCNRSMSQEIVT